jgi:putative MATE family efflux protein
MPVLRIESARTREILALAGPAIVAGLVSAVVFATDRLMLGWSGPAALGSMQLSGPVVWSVHSVFGVFSVGLLAVVGRATGAGQGERTRDASTATLAFAFAVGLAVAVLGVACADGLSLAMAGGSPEMASVRHASRSYVEIVFSVTAAVFVAVAGTAALQASGDTRTPMRIGAVTGLVNLGVSGLLVFGLGPFPVLGVQGAALGSAAAFVCQAVLVFWVLWQRGHINTMLPGVTVLTGHLWPVLRISGPAFGERCIFHAGFLVFAALVGRLGSDATTANQGLVAIESLGFITSQGFGVAAGALVAQKLGAARPDEATATGWTAAVCGAVCLGMVSLLFLAVPELLIGAFSHDPEVLGLGVRCLRVAAVAQPLMAIADVLAFSLRGAGDTRSPLVVALAGPVVVRLSACWFLAFHLDLGLLGIWVGTTLDWFVRAVCLALVFARGKWRTAAV